MDPWRWYRRWFKAATIYNLAWGVIAILYPFAMFDMLHIPRPQEPEFFRCIGMMVGVYALGYWLIAVDPPRFGAFVWVGLAGKVLGPIGFLFAAWQGRLPWGFGWINVANDLIWLPAFVTFAIRLNREASPWGLGPS